MATLPTLDEAERAILDKFKEQGSRPGEGFPKGNLLFLLQGNYFRASDLNEAAASMIEKGWMTDSGNFVKITDLGYEQI